MGDRMGTNVDAEVVTSHPQTANPQQLTFSGPALCVIFSPRDYLSAPRQELVLNFNLKVHPPIFMWGGGWLRLLLFFRR